MYKITRSAAQFRKPLFAIYLFSYSWGSQLNEHKQIFI